MNLDVGEPGHLHVSVYLSADLAVADDLGVFALAAISAAVDLEHDFPSWIGVNELSESYVVGLRFTRGNLETPGLYEFKNGRFKRLHFGNEA